MATFTANRAFQITNQGGNARVGTLGVFVDLYCPPTPTPVNTKTVTFTADDGGFEIPRLQYAGSFETTAVTLVNVAAITYYLNLSPVSGTVTFVAGDTLLVRLTKTTLGNPATVTIPITYASGTTTATSDGYLWENWENLQNATNLPNEWVETNDSLLFNGAIGYDKGANGSYRATGACTVEFAPVGLRFNGGLSDEDPVTFPTTLFNRIKHAWVIAYPNATCRYLGAVDGVATPLNSSVIDTYLFRVEDTGTEIQFQYSADNGANWATHFTSGQTYVPNTVWHSDVSAYFGGIRFRGLKLYGGSIV